MLAKANIDRHCDCSKVTCIHKWQSKRLHKKVHFNAKNVSYSGLIILKTVVLEILMTNVSEASTQPQHFVSSLVGTTASLPCSIRSEDFEIRIMVVMVMMIMMVVVLMLVLLNYLYEWNVAVFNILTIFQGWNSLHCALVPGRAGGATLHVTSLSWPSWTPMRSRTSPWPWPTL